MMWRHVFPVVFAALLAALVSPASGAEVPDGDYWVGEELQAYGLASTGREHPFAGPWQQGQYWRIAVAAEVIVDVNLMDAKAPYQDAGTAEGSGAGGYIFLSIYGGVVLDRHELTLGDVGTNYGSYAYEYWGDWYHDQQGDHDPHESPNPETSKTFNVLNPMGRGAPMGLGGLSVLKPDEKS